MADLPQVMSLLSKFKARRAEFAFLVIPRQSAPTPHPLQQVLSVQPAKAQRGVESNPNLQMAWGSSSVFRVDDCSYQKIEGSFYKAGAPLHTLGVFTAGLRGLDSCGAAYVDSWITVHRPPPQLFLNVEWEHVPGTRSSTH